jgi:hypothetical protein
MHLSDVAWKVFLTCFYNDFICILLSHSLTVQGFVAPPDHVAILFSCGKLGFVPIINTDVTGSFRPSKQSQTLVASDKTSALIPAIRLIDCPYNSDMWYGVHMKEGVVICPLIPEIKEMDAKDLKVIQTNAHEHLDHGIAHCVPVAAAARMTTPSVSRQRGGGEGEQSSSKHRAPTKAVRESSGGGGGGDATHQQRDTAVSKKRTAEVSDEEQQHEDDDHGDDLVYFDSSEEDEDDVEEAEGDDDSDIRRPSTRSPVAGSTGTKRGRGRPPTKVDGGGASGKKKDNQTKKARK